jgi:hypothetical protein
MCAHNDDDCADFEQHRQMMLDELDAERRGFLKIALVAGSGTAAAWAAGGTPVSAQAQGSGMARLAVLYKTPKDTAEFDRYYFETHVPIAKKTSPFSSSMTFRRSSAGLRPPRARRRVTI